MTRGEIEAFLLEEFPQVFATHAIVVAGAEAGQARLTLRPTDVHLRPGAVISGPTIMMLADAAAYVALLSLGPAAQMAVTTNLNMSFLRAGRLGGEIVQTAEVIKKGRRLAVILGETLDGESALLAHATMTYAMPDPAAG